MLKLNKREMAEKCFQETILPNLYYDVKGEKIFNLNTPCYGRSRIDDNMYLCVSDEDDYRESEYNKKFKNLDFYSSLYKTVYLNYYFLAEAIMNFEDCEENMKKLVDKIIAINLQCSIMNPLIDEIIKNFDIFRSSQAVLKLFKYRYDFVESKLLTMPADSSRDRYHSYYTGTFTYSDYVNEKSKLKTRFSKF